MEKSFTELYVNYACEITDSPIDFHTFMSYAVLSSCVNKKVYIKIGNKKLFPNIWLILLAPSSFFRKSTAISIGVDIIRNYDKNLILPNEFSQEKILEILQKQPEGTFVFYEFLSLMGLLQKDYMAGTKAFLTDIYDCPIEYTRKTIGKEIVIKDICINIFSATTMTWFLQELREGDLAGGFLPRFLFVPAKIKEKSLYLPPPANEQKKSILLKQLSDIASIKGEITFCDEAKKKYEEWCFKYEVSNQAHNELLIGFLVRLETYFLKLLMLENLDRFRSLTIQPQSVERVAQLINWLHNQVISLVTEEMTFTRFQTYKKKVLGILKGSEANGISREELLRKSRLSAKDLDNVIETLIQEKTIIARSIKEHTRPQLRYYITAFVNQGK